MPKKLTKSPFAGSISHCLLPILTLSLTGGIMSKNRKLFSALILILVGSLVQWAPSANATPKHVMKRDGSKVVTSAHPRYINADTQTTCLYAARPSGYVPTSLSITAGCGAYSTFGYNTVTWSAVQDGVSACLAVANSTYLGVGANYVPSRLSFNSKCGANSSYGYNQ